MRRWLYAGLLLALAGPVARADDALDCKADVGDEASSAYVRECLEVLPANAAKCNVANPCAQMKLEIQRACTAAHKSDAGKAFADSARQVCDKYSSAPATAR